MWGLIFSSSYSNTYATIDETYENYLEERVVEGYNIEDFERIETINKERVDKRNQIEKLLSSAQNTLPYSFSTIRGLQRETLSNFDNFNREIILRKNQAKQILSRISDFKYIPYSDGSKVYFRNRLTSRIENERIVDEFGNVSYKNTYDMKYNEKGLLISYKADITDKLGNINHIEWSGAKYTPDSVMYGGPDTNANKNILEYRIKETDSAGNIVETYWQTSGYEDKLPTEVQMRIIDSVYGERQFIRYNLVYDGNRTDRVISYYEEGTDTNGLRYELKRIHTSYTEKTELNQVKSYLEVKTVYNEDGTVREKITTEANFTYEPVPNQFGPDVKNPDPDRLLKSVITVTTESTDGAKRTETTTTNYEYDTNNRLVNAYGYSGFIGQEAKWYEYTDNQGHTLVRTTENDKDAYFYINPETLNKVYVPEDEITVTLKNGNKYKGSSEIKYEIREDGRPLVKQIETSTAYYGRNIAPEELQRIEKTTVVYDNKLVTYDADTSFSRIQIQGRTDHTEITFPLLDPDNSHTTVRDMEYRYKYDSKGNLEDVILVSGVAKGWEYQSTKGWYGRYISTITEDYSVILGKPIRTDSWEIKDYIDY